jgi:hypothetical protein
MSLMFNKLNIIYNIFKNPNYKEEYLRLRELIIENTNNDKMFVSKTEMKEKYKKERPLEQDSHLIINQVVNILNQNNQESESVNEDNYILIREVIDNNNKEEFEDDFCYV